MPSANPPRVYRAQKVVAKLEKDDRPVIVKPGMILGSPMDVVSAIGDYLEPRANEYFVCLFVNVRNQLIGYTEFTEGSATSVTVHPTGVFRAALAANAAAIVTVHNHPSGDPDPSQDDRLLWQRLRAGGDLVGIPILDNMVIGEDRFYSESENEVRSIPAYVKREAKEQGR